MWQSLFAASRKEGFFRLLQNGILTDFNLLLPCPFLWYLATHGKRQLAFFKYKPETVPSRRFRIQIQIWGSSDLAWHFGFGPRPDSPYEAVWHFQFWEAPLPGHAAAPRCRATPGVWPFAAESSPAGPGFSKKKPRLSLMQLIQLPQWRAHAFHDAAVAFEFLRVLKPRWIGLSAAMHCSCRKKKKKKGNQMVRVLGNSG